MLNQVLIDTSIFLYNKKTFKFNKPILYERAYILVKYCITLLSDLEGYKM